MELDNGQLDNIVQKEAKKNLAEESAKIRLADFGRKLLLPTSDGSTQKSGKFVIEGSRQVFVSYSIDLEKKPRVLKIWFTDNPNSLESGTSQEIELEEDIVNFGIRPFFRCECGSNARVLYKPRDQSWFKCRNCSHIMYEVCTINKGTMGGAFYYVNRLLKLNQKRAEIDRMFYGDKFTKKAQNFFRCYRKWGVQIPEEVRNLVELQLVLATRR